MCSAEKFLNADTPPIRSAVEIPILMYHGEAAPLMSWVEILEIAVEGTELGCHSLTHRPMTEMDYSDLLRDTRQAREILEFGLERSITHFAYPYGAENEIARSVIAALGFRSAVSCRPGLARFGYEILSLPRIEVPGICTPEELILQIGANRQF
jgi:peptidoglycan/xylan/chitin deacetylase (PgdA/CDA1 family)